MKRFWPYFLILSGVLLLLGGLIYGALFAGVPYQDPTPEMAASYHRHVLVSMNLVGCGFGAFLLGVAAGIVRRIARRHPSKAVSS